MQLKQVINETICKIRKHKFVSYTRTPYYGVSRTTFTELLIGIPWRKCQRCGFVKYKKSNFNKLTIHFQKYEH